MKTVSLPAELINAATYGLKLFPVRRDNKEPFSGFKWREKATSDINQLEQWAGEYPGCNWALATGQASGVFVVDLDGPKGQAWAKAIDLPYSLTVSTGKGFHVYFLTPANSSIKNSAGKIAPGVDIRGDGGYVVVPPSIHSSGKPYTYLNTVTPIFAPDWLVERLIQDHPASAPAIAQEPRQGATEAEKTYGANILKKACAEFASVPAGEGLRNDAANKLTYTIAGVVAAGWVEHDVANEAIKEATEVYRAQHPGVEKTLRSGWSKGLLKPCAPLPINTLAEELMRKGFGAEEFARRQRQQQENQNIGEGSCEYPSAKVLNLDQMVARYVHIVEGKRVVDLEHPRRIFALDEWVSAHRSSQSVVETKQADGKEKVKIYQTTLLWEQHPKRKQVDSITFRPGAGRVTVDPEGKQAANTWLPIDRPQVGGDASLFVKHVEYLFSDDAPQFLDWLAHIEQHPGVLPHTGWVHISPLQGTGRNWLASVLCRLWKGYVAASFDLSGTLSSGFNGSLSQKLLAVVDEINEGVSDRRWESAEKLKSLVTEEHRRINPKYGHQRLEYNACRWLIFSNHTSALPLTERDRRFNVVRNDRAPMPVEYYSRLYEALKDPAFIAGVALCLKNRDISTFNPGAHAVMSEVKREMVAASRSDADDVIEFLKENHPADVISNLMLGGRLIGQPTGQIRPHHRHALDRAGVKAYGKTIRIGDGLSKVSILRNHEFWKQAAPDQIRAELAKAFD